MAALAKVDREQSARPSERFSAPTRRRPRLPLGFLGALALIAVVETLLVRFRLDTPTPATMSWRLSSQAAKSEAVDCEVLIFGDSLVKHGLNARLLQAETGLKTYNLSVCACQSPANLALLKRALKAGARPRAIVFEAAPDLMAGKPDSNLRNWPELLDPFETIELSWRIHDAEFAGRVLLAEALPSYRARLEIRKLIVPPKEFDLRSRSEALRLAGHWTEERGSNVAGGHGAFDGRVSEDEQQTLLSDRFWCDRNNRYHLTAFLDEAKDRGIPVYWLLPPVSPAVQERRDRSGAEAKHLAFVEALTKPYPNVSILNFQHAGFSAPDFVDPRHMTGEAAKRLTRNMAAILKQGVDSRRR